MLTKLFKWIAEALRSTADIDQADFINPPHPGIGSPQHAAIPVEQPQPRRPEVW